MCVGLIHAVRAAVLTDHRPEHTRTEHPRVQFPPALAERIFKTLLRPCSETVERDRKACNTHFRHNELPFISAAYPIAIRNQLQCMITDAIMQPVFWRCEWTPITGRVARSTSRWKFLEIDGAS